jgi:hypothetical protein
LDHPEQWEHYVPRSTTIVASGLAPTAEIDTAAWKHGPPPPPPPQAREPAFDRTLPPPQPKPFWTGTRAFLASLIGVLLLALVGGAIVLRNSGKPVSAPAAKAAPVVPSRQTTAPKNTTPPTAEEPLPPSPETPVAGVPVAATIPDATALAIRLTGAVDGEVAAPDEMFPATITAPVLVGGKIVLANGAEAKVRLVKSTKIGRLHNVPKMEFELASVSGYPVRTGRFELSGEPHKKGKLGAVGSVFSRKGNADGPTSFTVPAETVMTFRLRAPLKIALR